MAWYHYDGIAFEWLCDPANIEVTREILEWFDDAPDEWEWLAHEAQFRAQRRQDAVVGDLVKELMEAPEFAYAHVGSESYVPKWWVPWIGMLLIHELPHIADWIRLPKAGHKGWPRGK